MPNWIDGLKAKVMGTPPGVYLAAFGKHPGWDDHIEPIGLDSEPLLVARDILYVRGIGGAIDAALWDKKPEETLPGIAHVFCWNGDSDMLIGRMWSSTDGKGRAKYPMVAVAHLGIPFSYSLAVRAEHVLAGVEARCHLVSTADGVRGIFAAGLDELRASLAQPADSLGPEPDRAACSQLAAAMNLGEGKTFARTLYTLEGKVRTFAHAPKVSGKISLKMLESDAPAQQCRLPADPADPVGSIAFWQKVVAEFSPTKLPLLFLQPAGHPWVDLILGKPLPTHLYCLRANEAALPPASTVPYELDSAFVHTAADFLSKICDPAVRKPSAVVAPEAQVPPPLPPAVIERSCDWTCSQYWLGELCRSFIR